MDILLKRLKFLALDCQATGNSPKSGHLLEIGWFVFGANMLCEPEISVPKTFFIRPPDGFVLPAHVTKLTGINSTHFTQSVPDRYAMKALNEQSNIMVRQNQRPFCPTVIHYARYEMGWLNHLYQTREQSQRLPLEVLCTHQMASRIFPKLPRKGLRAVAGYLGHSVPPLKRCAAHLKATAYIWCKLIEKLANAADIHTTVVWKVANKRTERLNIIQLCKGKVSNRYETRSTQPIPLPQNHSEPHDHRQAYIDLKTYDRLRVLTTEMRRLITEDRMMCIRLGKKAYLYPDQLRVLFKWI